MINTPTYLLEMLLYSHITLVIGFLSYYCCLHQEIYDPSILMNSWFLTGTVKAIYCSCHEIKLMQFPAWMHYTDSSDTLFSYITQLTQSPPLPVVGGIVFWLRWKRIFSADFFRPKCRRNYFRRNIFLPFFWRWYLVFDLSVHTF